MNLPGASTLIETRQPLSVMKVKDVDPALVSSAISMILSMLSFWAEETRVDAAVRNAAFFSDIVS